MGLKKVFKIYELISTSLESITVSDQFGYGDEVLHSFLYRMIDSTKLDIKKIDSLNDGFDSLEEAEEFMVENMEEFEQWTIVCEYTKRE